VKSISAKSNPSLDRFEYLVEFLNEDGSLFVRGPCCGGNATDDPPESSFLFTVVEDSQGKFLVMELPPYVP
jgi:hypothetical protein